MILIDNHIIKTAVYLTIIHGWLVTARLLVRSPAPPSYSVVVSLSEMPSPTYSWPAGCRPAWFTPPPVCECVHEWVNVNQHCKALWIKALYKWGLLTIYYTWTPKNKDNILAGIYLFLLAVYLFLLAWRDDRHTRGNQYPEFEIAIMGYCPISRDSKPIKLHHLRRFTCSIYYIYYNLSCVTPSAAI